MTFANRAETDESAIPGAMRVFFRNRFMEAGGLVSLGFIGMLSLALASWKANDPALGNAPESAHNLFGYAGALVADELMGIVGLGVLGLLAVPTVWAMGLLVHRPLLRFPRSLVSWSLCVLTLSAALAAFPLPSRWALDSGLGGSLGDAVLHAILWFLSFGLKGSFANVVGLSVLGFTAMWLFFSSINHSHVNHYILTHIIGERGHDMVDASMPGLPRRRCAPRRPLSAVTRTWRGAGCAHLADHGMGASRRATLPTGGGA